MVAKTVGIVKKPRSIMDSYNSTTTYVMCITVAVLGFSLFSMYSVILVLFGLLPGFVAMIIDMEKQKYISKLVLCYNSLGLAPFIINILKHYHQSKVAIETIIDPFTWMIIFSSAALGWVIYWLFPEGAIFYQNLRVNLKIKQLEAEINELAKEWGEEIKSVNVGRPQEGM